MIRIAGAVFGGSIASALLAATGLGVLAAARVDGVSPDSWFGFFVVFLVAAGLNAVVALTIGLGWHAFASHRGWRSVHAYWIPALIVGLIPPQLIILPVALRSGPDWTSVWITTSLLGAALGGFTGLFAWLIRRPDRVAANPDTSPS